MEKKILFNRPPFLYSLSGWDKRIPLDLNGYTNSRKYASFNSAEQLPFRVKKHQSVLFPKLGNSEMLLQYNNMQNLKLAIKELNGILIRPGETFSFCRLPGRFGKSRQFKEGVKSPLGESRPGTDDDICQISNLINWLLMHSPLKIIDRHQHNCDHFPDGNRKLPFDSGVAVIYDYRDCQFENKTDFTFQLKIWISEKCLEGELRADRQLSEAYRVFEKCPSFQKIGQNFYRKNEIWRKKYLNFKIEEAVEAELLIETFTYVPYVLADFQISNEHNDNKLYE